MRYPQKLIQTLSKFYLHFVILPLEKVAMSLKFIYININFYEKTFYFYRQFSSRTSRRWSIANARRYVFQDIRFRTPDSTDDDCMSNAFYFYTCFFSKFRYTRDNITLFIPPYGD